MSIIFENETTEDFGFNAEELVGTVINQCLDYIQCPFESIVEVTLVENAEIHRLNREFRDTDRPTDVLSFPMINYETAGDFSFLEEDDEELTAEYFDFDSGELLLGDIVISVDKVKEQAEEYGHSVRRELAFLVAHSMFHLFGFDHMEEEERIHMEHMQREVLEQLGIER